MPIMVDGGNAQEFEKPNAGLTAAVCIAVVDLGVQENDYQGEKSKKRQVAFVFEVEQTYTEGKYVGERMLASKIMTASLNEKATLRRLLASWRGKDFDEAELFGYDVEGWKGAPCMLNLVLNAKGYAKVEGVMPAMADKRLEPNRLNYVPQWIKDIANRGEGGQKFSGEEDEGSTVDPNTGEPSFF